MSGASSTLRHLIAPEAAPIDVPDLYSGVMNRISDLGESPWTVMLYTGAGSKLVVTCLTLIVLLGGYLLLVEGNWKSQAAQIITVPNSPASVSTRDPAQRRDAVLVNLVSYSENDDAN